MTMENQEEILDALASFEKKPCTEIPPVLENYLRQVAKNGETLFPWNNIKTLFLSKLDQVMVQFNREYSADHLPSCPNVENCKFEEMRSRILQTVEDFQGAPFTIQRLCELLTDPRRHYKRSDKFLRGIEKNVLVVTTVDPFGRKVVSETRNMVNGLSFNGFNNGQGDGQPLQYSTFPSSPFTNAFTDRGRTFRLSEQCDEIPEAENEKILRDIMESEKLQNLEEQEHEDIQKENLESPATEDQVATTEEESVHETEQESLKDTKNNTNSDIQNASLEADEEGRLGDNHGDSNADDATSDTPTSCHTTENHSDTEGITDNSEEHIYEEGKEKEATSESVQENETDTENPPIDSDSTEDRGHLQADNDDDVCSNNGHSSESVPDVHSTDTEPGNETSVGDDSTSSENQTQLLNTETVTENIDVTECDNTCDSSDDRQIDISSDPENRLSGIDGVESNVTSVADRPEALTSDEEVNRVTSTVNMDIDSSNMADQCKQDSENSENCENLDDQTKNENEETEDSHEVPMEQD